MIAVDKYTVPCPKCDQRLLASAENAGMRAKCSSCGHSFLIPDPPKSVAADSEKLRIPLDDDPVAFDTPPRFKTGARKQQQPAPLIGRIVLAGFLCLGMGVWFGVYFLLQKAESSDSLIQYGVNAMGAILIVAGNVGAWILWGIAGILSRMDKFSQDASRPI